MTEHDVTPEDAEAVRVLATMWTSLAELCGARESQERLEQFFVLEECIAAYMHVLQLRASRHGFEAGAATQARLMREGYREGYLHGVRDYCTTFGLPVPDSILNAIAEREAPRPASAEEPRAGQSPPTGATDGSESVH